jgi:pimeloyl-ACP methyl ester carboxylesterase
MIVKLDTLQGELVGEWIDKGGIPTILIPGILTTSSDYIEFARRLPSSVLIINLRGQGLSLERKPIPPMTTPMDYTLVQLATDVFEFILLMKFTQFTMMGFDIGGIVSMQLALLLNGRDDLDCSKMVLLSTCSMTPSRGLLRTSIMPLFDFSKWIELNLGPKYKSQSQQSLSIQAPTQEQIGNAQDYIYCINDFNLTDQLNLIKIPSLIIHGTGIVH